MQRLEGSGDYADRVQFLEAVRQEAPQALRALFELLTPERVGLLDQRKAKLLEAPQALRARWDMLARTHAGRVRAETAGLPALLAFSADVSKWADRWNLARFEADQLRGAWVFRVAAKTLWTWARCLRADVPVIDATTRSLAWSHLGHSYWSVPREPPKPDAPIQIVGDLSRLRLPKKLKPPKLGEPPPPFYPANSIRPPNKKRIGRGVEVLRVSEDWRLIAFARWQMVGASAVRLRNLWPGYKPSWASSNGHDAKHADSAIAKAMDVLCDQLDLPKRPRSKPGRRRAAGQ